MAPVVAARRMLLLAAGALLLGSAAQEAAPGPAARAAACGSLSATSLDHAVPWAQRRLGFQRVWPITEGAGVTVAAVDTGVAADQPFLRGAVLRGQDVINGDGPADSDCDGHGTFVAGIIADRPQPGFGLAGVAARSASLPSRAGRANLQGWPRNR